MAEHPISGNSPFPPSAQWTLAVLLSSVLLLMTLRWFQEGNRGRPSVWQSHRVDLNTASRGELTQLPGIGLKKADRLVEQRETEGSLSPTELPSIPGFGAITTRRLLAHVEPGSFSKGGPNNPKADLPKTLRKNKPLPNQPVNVNVATHAELLTLPGIGDVLAQRIIEERTKKRFEIVEDLRRVTGIGRTTLEKVRPYVIVGNEK